MDARHRVLDNDFIDNASGEATTPTTCSSVPLPSGEGDITRIAQSRKHRRDYSRRSPTWCICGVKCSRPDALKRHIKGGAPKHPCNNCDRYRGTNGFYRRDHLVQHMKSCRGRNVGNDSHHHKAESFPVVTMPGPSLPVNGNTVPLVSLPPFPCLVPGCNKRGLDGYLRLQDLTEHQGWAHPFMVQNLGATTQLLGDMQSYQSTDDPQLYQADSNSQVYQQDGASQFPRQAVDTQLYQPVDDNQPDGFDGVPYLSSYEQYGAYQTFQLDVTSQPLQPEAAFENYGQDDIFHVYQQGGPS